MKISLRILCVAVIWPAGWLMAATSERLVPVEPMAVPRQGHTATVLADGRVLIVGGDTATAELFDPTNRTFVAVGNMSRARRGQTVALLPDGRVLIAGGTDGDQKLASTEIFDPVTATFSAGGTMTAARSGHSATKLADGRVLLAGGDDGGTAEIFDPSDGSFTAVPHPIAEVRAAHLATVLSDNSGLLGG